MTEKEILVAVRPAAVKVDDRRRLHCETGPAFDWLRDIQDYYWHGVHVPDFVVMAPEKITAAVIEKEENAEVRRVMIERYVGGQAKYLIDSGAKQIHADDFGVLFSKELPGDEPLVMVKVVNSTPEPDGSFKDYFLRVDPQLRPLPDGTWSAEEKLAWMERQKPQALTAHNAVASTWGMRGEQYAPLVET